MRFAVLLILYEAQGSFNNGSKFDSTVNILQKDLSLYSLLKGHRYQTFIGEMSIHALFSGSIPDLKTLSHQSTVQYNLKFSLNKPSYIQNTAIRPS
jgi:hypothetical protein